MSNPFIGEMRLVAFDYAPRYWAMCDGAVMSISQNQALFAVIGNAFGGDGVTTFALPDCRGRVPIGAGRTYGVGFQAGEEEHLLQVGEVPAHTHVVQGVTVEGNQAQVAGGLLANVSSGIYAPPGDPTKLVALVDSSVAYLGGYPHENRQPYTVVSMAIALSGIFPSKG